MGAPDSQFWKQRMHLPTYRVADVARFAEISPRTLAYWYFPKGKDKRSVLPDRDRGGQVSYLEMVEAAFVATMRKSGVSLDVIRDARDYLRTRWQSEFPFATYRFKTDGKNLLMDFDQLDAMSGEGKLLIPNKHGQLAWSKIVDFTFDQFEYEDDLAIRWHIKGPGTLVVIDPSVAFGAPSVRGVPTNTLADRYQGGDSIAELGDDFRLPIGEIREALKFEGIAFRDDEKEIVLAS